MAEPIAEVMEPQPKSIFSEPSHWYYHEPENWWTCGDNSGQTWEPPHKVGDRIPEGVVVSCVPVRVEGVWCWVTEVGE